MKGISLPVRIAVVVVLLGIAVAVGLTTTGDPQQPPYPPSTVITAVHWSQSDRRSLAPGSDLWPITWAADGALFTAWGDGGGFGGDNHRGRVSLGIGRIDGTPPDIHGVNINGGVNTEAKATWHCSHCGKTAGLLAIGNTLYMWLHLQNEGADGSLPQARLAWSEDNGRTWQLSKWSFPDPASPTFQPSTFLNAGRGYANAPDRFVYSYGGRWIPGQGRENSLYLMRASTDHLRDRGAWQFYAGTGADGNARWTDDIAKRKPVFTDANGVNNLGAAAVIYLPHLKRYLLTVGHRPPGKGVDAGAGRLGIFDAPTPWGPWTTVAYYSDWLNAGDSEALVYNIPTKWLSGDDRQFWMVFSSDDADSFNLVRGELEVAANGADNHSGASGGVGQ